MVTLTPTEMIMLDTSLWIALLDSTDSCREKAINIVKSIESENLYIFDYIYAETLTVLRNKALDVKLHELTGFLEAGNLKVNISDSTMFSMANELFFRYKKLSFVDCTLMATAKIKKGHLLTFDKQLQKAWDSEQNAS